MKIAAYFNVNGIKVSKPVDDNKIIDFIPLNNFLLDELRKQQEWFDNWHKNIGIPPHLNGEPTK
jgi:hypothetical protein